MLHSRFPPGQGLQGNNGSSHKKFPNLLQECQCLPSFGDTTTGTSLPMAPKICLFSLFYQLSVLTTIPNRAQSKETLKAGIYKEFVIPQHQTPSADVVPIHQSSAPSGHIQFKCPNNIHYPLPCPWNVSIHATNLSPDLLFSNFTLI